MLDRVSNYQDDTVVPLHAHRRSAVLSIHSEPVGGAAKRRLDIALAVLFAPLFLALAVPIALLIALDGGRPIFAHMRIGRNGRPFRCYKFRTMIPDSETKLVSLLRDDFEARQQWHSSFKLTNDPRVTRLGWFLRKTSLDELPQLWNVLRGDMSWVGPRPVTEPELGKYGSSLPAYLSCRPGLTGLWQLHRTGETTYEQRVAFDVQYTEQWSIAGDLWVLLRTIPYVLAGRGLP